MGDGSSHELIDRDGRVLKTLRSTWLRRGDGLLLMRVGYLKECGQAGGDVSVYLDARGESAFDGRFCGAHEFSDGLARAWRDGKYGALQFMLQYAYLFRNPWYVAPGAPKNTHENAIWFNLRYTLPGSAPTIKY